MPSAAPGFSRTPSLRTSPRSPPSSYLPTRTAGSSADSHTRSPSTLVTPLISSARHVRCRPAPASAVTRYSCSCLRDSSASRLGGESQGSRTGYGRRSDSVVFGNRGHDRRDDCGREERGKGPNFWSSFEARVLNYYKVDDTRSSTQESRETDPATNFNGFKQQVVAVLS
ncbi:hypothetical protein EI94DRAFT_1759201 [Lactarius quietus]|nr:hypothetical protein EI94DRAFT_1759201 [Lactarius quietus]